MRIRDLYIYTFALVVALAAGAPAEHSAYVAPGEDGRLHYQEFHGGDVVPDFSFAGYRGGGVAIPMVRVVKNISPAAEAEDDTARIQQAIDEVSAMPADADGFRGALVLDAGIYRISGSLKLNESGVVLRGSGPGSDGTVLIATGTTQRPLIEAKSDVKKVEDKSSRQPIADTRVPVGTHRVTVADASGFKVGDAISIIRPASDAWITELGMDRIPERAEDNKPVEQWKADTYIFHFERRIAALEGNTIVIDVPLPQSFESEWGGGSVMKLKVDGRLDNIGVENMRLVSDYKTGEQDKDEAHATEGVMLDGVENSWVRYVTGKHFVRSLVKVERDSRRVTVQDCLCLDYASIITGERRYGFYVIGAENLVQRCATRNGRHDFVGGSRVLGPNAFVDCLATETKADIGPHHRWSMGFLWDNIHGGEIRVRNRANRGSGHGWAGAQNVLWNCEAKILNVQSPPTGWNLAIGCIAPIEDSEFEGEDGIYELHGTHVEPRSLYIAQLRDRLGDSAVEATVSRSQLDGTIFDKLAAKLAAEKEGRDDSL